MMECGITEDHFENKRDAITETIIHNFIKFAYKKLHIHDPHPKIIFSYDLPTTKQLHRTGSYDRHTNTITVYAKNRNLVDILRTLCHEIAHKRQAEEGRIHQKSPPGSKLEREADEIAGYLIKLYAAKHREIFQ
jgi:hypothetical protein